jgi:hypothetical protein
VSADRRFKFSFIAVVLLVVIGFGSWYGFVRQDGGAGEAAQDVIAQDPKAQDRAAQDRAAQEPAAEAVDAPVDTLVAIDSRLIDSQPVESQPVESQPIERLPESATPAGEAVSGSEAASQSGPAAEVAAVDASGETPAVSESAAAAPPPVFDIVRVEPSGEAIIAGRSIPGAVIELVRNGVVHDRLVADASGSFAFIPPPLPVGTSEIVLRVTGADGVARQSEQSITVVVADDLRTAPMVAKVAPNQPTIVLSQPEAVRTEVAAAQVDPVPETTTVDAAAADLQQLAAADATAIQSGRPAIRIASVEAETGGGLYVSGEVSPSATVRLYLNDTFVAPAEAGADGMVSFSIERGVRPGSYRVRLDEVAGETGSVLSRAEIVFIVPEFVAEAPVEIPDATISPEPAEQVVAEAEVPVEAPERAASAVIPEIATAVVTRGDSLWRISRQVYGSGFRYTEIFEANQNQIRNPDLIYPGQLFVLPADPAREQDPATPGRSVN